MKIKIAILFTCLPFLAVAHHGEGFLHNFQHSGITLLVVVLTLVVGFFAYKRFKTNRLN